MNDTNLDFNQGSTNQVAPNATTQNQIFYGDQFAKTMLGIKEHPLTLVVLGAGADATLGLPTSSNLIPRIVEYLETEEGKAVDASLRKAIGSVRFHFDKFVNNAIDSLAKDLDKELITICRNITSELDHNETLTDEQRKLGNLIVRLFKKIIDIKCGASIDAETENPILRHVYRNILDIEQLLSRYFYGFYTAHVSYVRDYLYISWILWAYLVHEEQQLAQEVSFDPDRKSIPIPSFLPPLKLQTIISKKYIDTWYQASQMLLRANRIVILGYSFGSTDHFFCEYLRENHGAQLIIIDKNIEAVSRNVCNILQLAPKHYSRQMTDGIELRRYANRVTIVGADLAEVDLERYLK